MDKNKGSQQSNKDLTQGINKLQNINTTLSLLSLLLLSLLSLLSLFY